MKWIDKLIEEAMARGEFENLPGAGKPIHDLTAHHDPLWWVKRLLKRERLSLSPPAWELRKLVEEGLERIARQRTEADVRRVVAELNEQIREQNARTVAGPPSDVALLDADALVERWKAGRGG